jgi:PPOX class probable F420-dependent enzyme
MAEEYENYDEALAIVRRLMEREAPAVTPHAEERLLTEPIVWLATVRPDGSPHQVPVWFLWDGNQFLIFAPPGSRTVRNIRANPRVSLALDPTSGGSDVIVVDGTARLDPAPAAIPPAYEEKYRARMERLGFDRESMAREYSTAIWVTPTRIRA